MGSTSSNKGDGILHESYYWDVLDKARLYCEWEHENFPETPDTQTGAKRYERTLKSIIRLHHKAPAQGSSPGLGIVFTQTDTSASPPAINLYHSIQALISQIGLPVVAKMVNFNQPLSKSPYLVSKDEFDHIWTSQFMSNPDLESRTLPHINVLKRRVKWGLEACYENHIPFPSPSFMTATQESKHQPLTPNSQTQTPQTPTSPSPWTGPQQNLYQILTWTFGLILAIWLLLTLLTLLISLSTTLTTRQVSTPNIPFIHSLNATAQLSNLEHLIQTTKTEFQHCDKLIGQTLSKLIAETDKLVWDIRYIIPIKVFVGSVPGIGRLFGVGDRESQIEGLKLEYFNTISPLVERTQQPLLNLQETINDLNTTLTTILSIQSSSHLSLRGSKLISDIFSLPPKLNEIFDQIPKADEEDVGMLVGIGRGVQEGAEKYVFAPRREIEAFERMMRYWFNRGLGKGGLVKEVRETVGGLRGVREGRGERD